MGWGCSFSSQLASGHLQAHKVPLKHSSSSQYNFFSGIFFKSFKSPRSLASTQTLPRCLGKYLAVHQTPRGAGGAAPGSHHTETPRKGRHRPAAPGPNAAIPPACSPGRTTGFPAEPRARHRFGFKPPDPATPQSPAARPPNPDVHAAREEEENARERGAAPRSAPPARRGPAARGKPRPGRWDRRGVRGKLGGREAGPAGRQRRPMGSAEHDVTALITAWLWLTKRTMSLPSSPLPPWKKSPPTPGLQPTGQGGVGAAG